MRLKENKREWTDQVRDRMVVAMKHVIMNHPNCRSRSAFAIRISTSPSLINRWENQEGHPTIENICDACKEFNFSAEWMLLGNGKMFGDADVIKRLDDLEERVGDLEFITGTVSRKKKK